jgi:hypothetical protein
MRSGENRVVAIWSRRSESRTVRRSENDPPEGGSFYVLTPENNEESACGNCSSRVISVE